MHPFGVVPAHGVAMMAFAVESRECSERLRAGLEALRAGDDVLALDEVLAAWRDQPAPALASLIDQLGTTLSAREAPVTKVGSRSEQEVWLTLAAEGRAASLPALMAAVVTPHPRTLIPRLEALAAWPRDPRLATQIVRWIDSTPVAGAFRDHFFPRVIEMLLLQRDPRTAAAVEALLRPERRAELRRTIGMRSYRLLTEAAERCTATTRALDAEEQALVDEFLRLTRPESTAEDETRRASLLADVYAQPDDDGPRMVLADYLLARGDVRGEFIALQCQDQTTWRRSPHERELVQRYGRSWLGALADWIGPDTVRYRRGFPVAGYLNLDGRAEVASLPRELATFEALSFGGDPSVVREVLLSPQLPALRRVRVAYESTFRKLGHFGAEVAWHTLHLVTGHYIVLDGLGDKYTLLGLRRLLLSGVVAADACVQRFCASPMMAQLEHVAFGLPKTAPNGLALVAAALPSLPKLCSITLSGVEGWTVCFERRPSGWCLWVWLAAKGGALPVLADLPRGLISTLCFEGPKPGDAELVALGAAADHLGCALEVLTQPPRGAQSWLDRIFVGPPDVGVSEHGRF